MNGFRVPKKRKVTAQQASVLATVAAAQQAFPARVAAKWAFVLSLAAVLLSSTALVVALVR